MTHPAWYRSWLDEAAPLDSRDIFFVLGCQKSGTTWVQKLLQAHPQLCCGGEGHLADLLAPMLQQSIQAYNQRQADRGEHTTKMPLHDIDLLGLIKSVGDRLLTRYLQIADNPTQVVAVGEKTPEYAIYLPLLQQLYPSSKYVHVIRDGRDAAVSGYAHLQRQGKVDQFADFAAYVGYFAQRHWVHYITKARKGGMSSPDNYFEVRYEDLQADPAHQVSRMLAFLKVDTESALVEGCIEAGSFRQLSGGRDRGEEDPGSFFRKGVVGEWRTHFDQAAQTQFHQHAESLLRELGYEVSAVPVA